jgi:hypothetical protein
MENTVKTQTQTQTEKVVIVYTQKNEDYYNEYLAKMKEDEELDNEFVCLE